MAITVENLFEGVGNLYQLKLIAGERGLSNLVEWVHIIENDNVSEFLHGNEVVFTSGILNDHKGWLLNYAKKLYEVHISAFVVNLGPYTEFIPQEVIEYCNEVNMPLFTIPWKTRMVDITRDICYRIMQKENEEKSILETIKNIIFKAGDLEREITHMERFGFERDSLFCFVVMYVENSNTKIINELKAFSEKTARGINELFIAFLYNKALVLTLVNYSNSDIETFVNNFLNNKGLKIANLNIHMGISENVEGYNSQSENFERAFKAMKMAVIKKKEVVYYNDLGIYKLLLDIRDKKTLKKYYESNLGKIEKYDNENGTNYVKFLKVYFESNCSQQIVSEKMFIHRNTVSNYMKKIEKIMGIDEMKLEEKLKLLLAFYIKDIM